MNNIDFVKPENLEELQSILGRLQEGTTIIAGGTNVIPHVRAKHFSPGLYVDILDLKELAFIREDEETISIGAATTLSELESSQLIREKSPLLQAAIGQVGSPLTRNRATIGGNLADASPSADTAPPLLALEAKIQILNARGESRDVPVESFFLDYRSTVLKSDEFIASICFTKEKSGVAFDYQKIGLRKAMSISIVSYAAAMEIDQGTCKNIRIGLGSVAPTPIRAFRTEKLLQGKKVDRELLEEGCKLINEEISPISDIRGSDKYRRVVTASVFKRSMERSLGLGGE